MRPKYPPPPPPVPIRMRHVRWTHNMLSLLVLLLLLQSLHLTNPIQAEATSNINSIWMSNGPGGDRKSFNSKSANNSHPIHLDQNYEGDVHKTYASRPEEARPVAASESWQLNSNKRPLVLQTSSSSHQPSIVSFETPTDDNKQRRSDIAEFPFRGSNFSDEPAGSSIESSWAGTSLSASSGKPQLTGASNSQVQFDDLVRLGNSSSSSSFHLNPSSERRHDIEQLRRLLVAQSNDTTTSGIGRGVDGESPAHHPAFSQHFSSEKFHPFEEQPNNSSQQHSDADSLQEGDIYSNFPSVKLAGSSLAEGPTRDNQLAPKKRQDSSNSSEPFIYYLPNGDKWNYAGQEETTSTLRPETSLGISIGQMRRKLHNSGTQYDLRESDGLSLHPTTSSFSPMDQSGGQVAFEKRRYPPQRSSSDKHQGSYGYYQQVPEVEPAVEMRKRPNYYSGITTATVGRQNEHQSQFAFGGTTPQPHFQSLAIPSGYLTGAESHPYRPQQQQEQQPMSKMHFQLPQQNLQFVPLNNFKRFQQGSLVFPVQELNTPRRDESHQQNLWSQSNIQTRKPSNRVKEREKNSGGLFKYITKPKKSLLNVFSSVIGGGNQHTLEETFYESPPTRLNLGSGWPDGQFPPSVSLLQSVTQPFQNQQATSEAEQPIIRPSGSYQYNSLLPATSYYPAPSAVRAHHQLEPLSATIEQPTVGPAPSSLQTGRYQMGGYSQYPYAQSASSGTLRRRRVPLTGDQSHQKGLGPQPASSGANFIPVVAVQVTKTSPAPRPVSEEAYGSENTNELPHGNGGSSAVIDDYLEMKVGGRNRQKNNQEEYGNLASGSISSKTINKQQTSSPVKQQPGTNQHTTTVKSAVFGYLPHQAQQPVLQALNILPDYSTGSAQHLYQPVDADEQHQSQVLQPIEEPPSLGLQLQANNLVQNDIAHSFYDYPGGLRQAAASAFLAPKQYYTAGGEPMLRPTFEVYPTHQAQLHGFHLVTNQNRPEANLRNLGYNPILAYPAKNVAGQLVSSASDINPLLPFMFASPTGSEQNSKQFHSGDQPEQDSSSSFESTDKDTSENGQQQMSKGRKRSGDFFASAGQLLLSALPLLLAPTLGLMFASAPNPVARYQAPVSHLTGTQSAAAAPQIFTMPSPSNYINNETITTAASSNSPAPKLFTQSPLEFGYPANLSGNALPTGSKSPPEGQNLVAKNKRKVKPSEKTTPAPQKTTTIILTTLGPPPFVNETVAEPSLLSRLNRTQHVPQTIMLITDQELDSLANQSGLMIQNGSLLGANKLKNHHYDIGGYEGADFDAQFASLRKHTKPGLPNKTFQQQHPLVQPVNLIVGNKTKTNHTINNNNTRNNNSNNTRNQYQYSEVASTISPFEATEFKVYESESLTNKSLFPVTTWPPMRRKTVSLVTSNGNKTLPDSSEKYNRFATVEAPNYGSKFLQAAGIYGRDRNSVGVSTTFDDDDQDQDQDQDQDTEQTYYLGRNQSAILRSQHGLASNHRHDLLMSDSSHSSESSPKLKRVRRETRGRLVKVVKKIVRVPASTQANITSGLQMTTLDSAVKPTVSMNGQPQQPEEPLNGDASRKAAHIITTMITHADDAGDYDTQAGNGTSSGIANGEQDDYGGAVDLNQALEAVDELKERALRKKMAIDKIERGKANRPAPYRQLHHENNRMYASSQRPQEERVEFESTRGANPRGSPIDQFSSGGRGRIPSRLTPPIEVTSTKIRVFPNETLSRHSNKPTRGLVLNEDTKKALANFGTLLMKDTLETGMPEVRPHRGQTMKFRRELDKHPRGSLHRKQEIQSYEQYEPQIGSATESSFARSTPMPRTYTEQNGIEDLNFTPNPNFYYKQPPLEHHQQYHSPNGSGSADYSTSTGYSPVRDRVNLIETDEQQFGGDDRSYASGPMTDYYHANGHTNGYPSNRTNLANETEYISPNSSYPWPGGQQQLDRAPSSAYNVNSKPEIYSYNSYYPPPPRPYSSPAYESSAPRSNYPPPPAPSYRHPGSGYSNQADHNPYNYSHGYYNQHKSPDYPDMYQSYKPPPPSHPVDYQPQYPKPYGYHEPAASYRPAQGPEYYHQPPPRYHPEAPSNQAAASSLANQGNPLAMVSSMNDRNDPKAVNEYLKRVQFSDSDRDKLMASYLTCDGLLNDNDHCLERLSCEFSDPHNIEKANKLDRAVSSILLGHILINTYIPNQFKLRLKSASLFGYTQSGKCSRFVCNKLTKSINNSNTNHSGS